MVEHQYNSIILEYAFLTIMIVMIIVFYVLCGRVPVLATMPVAVATRSSQFSY